MRRVMTAVACMVCLGLVVIDAHRSVSAAVPTAPLPPDFVAGCTLPFDDIAGHHQIDHACTNRLEARRLPQKTHLIVTPLNAP